MLTKDRQISMSKARALIKRHACQFCNKVILGGNTTTHEAFCYLNPENKKCCPICGGSIKNYRKNKTCSIKCANKLFNKGPVATRQADQLGSKSASYRLTKDLLFKFITEKEHKCFRCNGVLTRNDFSIDHKRPWLNSENPVELFFDLNNIAFSHKSCNIKAARKPNKNM